MKRWILDHGSQVMLFFGVPLLTFDAVLDIYRHRDAFDLYVGIFALVGVVFIAATNAWIRGLRVGRKQGFDFAEVVTQRAVQDAVTASFMHFSLIQRALADLGPLCEVCGASNPEDMNVGVIPGPGNPPLYFMVSMRCPDHADLEKWPAEHVISLHESSEGS